MLPASNSGMGMNVGFPDVCVTPVGPVPTPIPYPNLAMNATAVPFAPNVLVSFVPALNMGSEMPITLGDQAGTLSPFMGPGRCTMGNPTVMVNALPAVNLTCPTSGNDMINCLGAVLVPSITNVFYSDASGQAPGAMDRAAMTSLARAAAADALEVVADGGALSLGETPKPPLGALRFVVRVLSSDVPARIYAALLDAGHPEDAPVILDLRGCPGGELAAAVALATDFLPEGAIIVTVTDGDGDETAYRARGGGPYAHPLAVLVDRGTASAAEVLAGALKAHGRAVVVGERTYGKGSAQKLVPAFAEPGACYATLATLVLPNGESVEGRGVAPDVEVAPIHALAAALAALEKRPSGTYAEVR